MPKPTGGGSRMAALLCGGSKTLTPPGGRIRTSSSDQKAAAFSNFYHSPASRAVSIECIVFRVLNEKRGHARRVTNAGSDLPELQIKSI